MSTRNFNTPWDSDYWMNSNGFYCGFNMPDALKTKNKDGVEIKQGIPEYKWRSAYLVDEYPACPRNWMSSEGRLASYFVPIQNDKGMWLDFNKNQNHTHDIAIVVSIQGVNAITGLPCNDAQLEQYIDNCPKHKKPFGANRYCEECGYHWPKQNYISTTGTPKGYLWLDGFRAANGAIQQYILTEQTMRGVASNILGSKRVYAIGISFFMSKEKRKLVAQEYTYSMSDGFKSAAPNYKWHKLFYCNDSSANAPNYNNSSTSGHLYSSSTEVNDSSWSNPLRGMRINRGTKMSKCCSTKGAGGSSVDVSYIAPIADAGEAGEVEDNSFAQPQFLSATHNPVNIQVKNMEIGAGASIDQQVYEDPEHLDYWHQEPEAILCINYCLELECEQILKQGKVSKQGNPMGFLKNVPVGN